MMWGDWGFGPWWGWLGMGMGGLGMLLVWALVIAGVVWAVRAASGPSQHYPPPTLPDTALDILKKRYARGEITKEQFEEMKRDLEG